MGSKVKSKDCVSKILFLIVVFVTSFALAKSSFVHVANPYQFYRSIDAYRLLPTPIAQCCAMILPTIQLTLAFGLMFGNLRFYSRLAVVVLVLFFLAQLSTVFRGIDLSCGCFSSSSNTSIGLASLAIPGGLATSLALLTFLNWDVSARSFRLLASDLILTSNDSAAS